MDELIRTLGIDWKLLVANTITFGIVLWILRRFAYRPIINLLDRRRQAIADSLAKAKQSAEEFKVWQQEKQRLVEEAKTEALRLVHQAERQAETLRQQQLAETQAESARLLARTKDQLARQQAQLVTEAKRELASLVVQATGKVIDQELDEDLDRRFSRRALEGLK
ncbi:MAG: F0F1 ATP synthase subunit B [Candidatus Kerfeldbacteria bacterium]|nr:F0F1 ATP synthase subunit B [Candidatus Kerfeldbacteria bacterium]